MEKKRIWIVMMLAVLIVGLAGAAALMASPPVVIECQSCNTSKDCGWPTTNLRCIEGHCTSNPNVGCE